MLITCHRKESYQILLPDGFWTVASTVAEDDSGNKYLPGNIFKDGLMFKSKFESYAFLVVDTGLNYYFSHVQLKLDQDNGGKSMTYDIRIGG